MNVVDLNIFNEAPIKNNKKWSIPRLTIAQKNFISQFQLEHHFGP